MLAYALSFGMWGESAERVVAGLIQQYRTHQELEGCAYAGTSSFSVCCGPPEVSQQKK
jgi:hypothetical protein